MAKYSPVELKQMAVEVLQAKELGDIRYNVLIHLLAHGAGLSLQECEEKINEYAKVDTS
jgi:hypothetical protein